MAPYLQNLTGAALNKKKNNSDIGGSAPSDRSKSKNLSTKHSVLPSIVARDSDIVITQQLRKGGAQGGSQKPVNG